MKNNKSEITKEDKLIIWICRLVLIITFALIPFLCNPNDFQINIIASTLISLFMIPISIGALK